MEDAMGDINERAYGEAQEIFDGTLTNAAYLLKLANQFRVNPEKRLYTETLVSLKAQEDKWDFPGFKGDCCHNKLPSVAQFAVIKEKIAYILVQLSKLELTWCILLNKPFDTGAKVNPSLPDDIVRIVFGSLLPSKFEKKSLAYYEKRVELEMKFATHPKFESIQVAIATLDEMHLNECVVAIQEMATFYLELDVIIKKHSYLFCKKK